MEEQLRATKRRVSLGPLLGGLGSLGLWGPSPQRLGGLDKAPPPRGDLEVFRRDLNWGLAPAQGVQRPGGLGSR